MVVSTSDIPAFEIDYLRQVTKRVIEDTAEADCRSKDGILVSNSINFLSDDYDKLANDVVYPPGVNESKYFARASALSQSAAQAAEEIDAGDEIQGYARYAVVRDEGKKLLALINDSLGTLFRYTTTTC